jgi:hypothetical protein
MFEKLDLDLKKSLINTKVLASNFKFIDELSKKNSSFNDNKYIPFYYHLGKYIKPEFFLEVGIDLGLIGGCFLQSCKTVNYYLGFQQKTENPWDKKIFESNIKKTYKNEIETYYGSLLDKNFLNLIETKKFDVAVINIQDNYDKLYTLCDFIYLNLNKNGFMVIDFIKNKKNEEIFFNIVNGYKKEYKVFDTRHGTGVLKK